MQTLDQQRAMSAYSTVKHAVQHLDDTKKQKFRTLAIKFPSMVRNCGVLQTLAFYQDKDDGSGVFKAFDSWLDIHGGLTPAEGEEATIVDRLCQPEVALSIYRMLQREAIAYGTWLKRAAETQIKEK